MTGDGRTGRWSALEDAGVERRELRGRRILEHVSHGVEQPLGVRTVLAPAHVVAEGSILTTRHPAQAIVVHLVR